MRKSEVRERSDKRETRRGWKEWNDHNVEFNLLTEPFAELFFFLFALVLVFALMVSLSDATRAIAMQAKAATTMAAVWSW